MISEPPDEWHGPVVQPGDPITIVTRDGLLIFTSVVDTGLLPEQLRADMEGLTWARGHDVATGSACLVACRLAGVQPEVWQSAFPFSWTKDLGVLAHDRITGEIVLRDGLRILTSRIALLGWDAAIAEALANPTPVQP